MGSIKTNNLVNTMLKITTLVLLMTSANGFGVDPSLLHGASFAKYLTSLTGTAGTGSVTIGSTLGDQKSCPPSFSCRLGNQCCFRRLRTWRCNYRDCMPLESYLETEAEIGQTKLTQYSDYSDYSELESNLETEAEVGQTIKGQENKAKSNMRKQVNNKTKTGVNNVKELKITHYSDYIAEHDAGHKGFI